jgi:hypothetical protein
MIEFMMVIALSLGHKNRTMNILIILDYWKKTGFFKDSRKPFHFKVVFLLYFEITIAFFAVLSLYFAS